MVVTTNSRAHTVQRYPMRFGGEATVVFTRPSGRSLPTDPADTARRGMRGFVEPALARDPDVAAVREVNARAQTTNHGRQIVLGARAQRPGAERHAVRRTVHEPYEPLQGSGIGDDPRQSEDGPGRIIGMDGEAHADLLGNRCDALEEVREVVP